MRTTGRKLFLLAALALAGLSRADTHDDVVSLFSSMTSALSQNNPNGFLRGFDKNFPNYEKLSTYIAAILENGEVAASLEFLKDEGDDQKRTVEVDWLLELRGTNAASPLVRRRQVVQCRLERQKGRWRIVELSPISFFAPPKYS